MYIVGKYCTDPSCVAFIGKIYPESILYGYIQRLQKAMGTDVPSEHSANLPNVAREQRYESMRRDLSRYKRL